MKLCYLPTTTSVLLLLSLLSASCEKVNQGFISDNITYTENPFTVTQGRVAYSRAVQGDGSTTPLKFKLLEVRKLDGPDSGKVAPEFTKVYPTTLYKSLITQKDTILDKIMSKVYREDFPVFQVNESGGSLQFSAATIHLAPGKYTIDLEASNDAGAKTLKNACTIVVNPGTSTPTITGKAYGYTLLGEGGSNPKLEETTLPVSITTELKTDGSNTITYRFLDKNGDVIDPITYGLSEVKRGNDYKFSEATPWHRGKPGETTTASIRYNFPLTPFPYSWIDRSRGYNFGLQSTALKSKTGLNNVLIRLDNFRLYVEGSYTVTVQLADFDI